MKMEVHIHVHHESCPTIEVKLDKILANQGVIMGKADELKAELVEINTTTNEIAQDLDDLVAKVGTGSMTPAEADEVKTELLALKAKLQGVAAVHTPGGSSL